MNQRRSNGIRKLPTGRYQITFRALGKKHRESFDREKDARSALDERRTSVRNREYVAPAKIPAVEKPLGHGWTGKGFPNRNTADRSRNPRLSFGKTILTVSSCLLLVPTGWIVWIQR